MSANTWGALVLDWRQAQLAMACADSLDQCHYPADELELCKVLVDNGSGDDASLEYIEPTISSKGWAIHKNATNLGFAGGMNSGLECLAYAKPSYVLLLNSDITLARSAVAELLQFVKTHPDAAIIGLSISDAGPDQSSSGSVLRYYSWLGWARSIKADRANFKTDYLNGAAMLCKTDFLNRIGGIPSNNFLYFEELQMRDKLLPNESIALCRTAIASHIGGASTVECKSPSRHYYAALACLRYTKNKYAYKFPTVLLTRLSWLAWLSLQTRTKAPLLDLLLAVFDLFTGKKRTPNPRKQ